MTRRELLAEWRAQAEREGVPWAPFEEALRALAVASERSEESSQRQVGGESSRDEPNPPPPVEDAEIGDLVERLERVRSTHVEGDFYRAAIDEAISTIRTLQARVAEGPPFDVAGPYAEEFSKRMAAESRAEAAEARASAAEGESEQLRLAICGGEDAPGYAASLPLETILKAHADNAATARRDAELAWDGETANSWKARAQELEDALSASPGGQWRGEGEGGVSGAESKQRGTTASLTSTPSQAGGER